MTQFSKLRSLGINELRVRSAQSLNSLLERRGWSSLTKMPSEQELLNLLGENFKTSNELLAHYRARTSPKFFKGLSNRQQTVDSIRAHFPGLETQILETATRISKGEFDLLGLRGLSFGEPIDWQLEPVSNKRSPLEHWSRLNFLDPDVTGDKKIVWELNRHQYFIALGQAYWLSNDERFAEIFVAHLNGWMDSNPPKAGINWASSLEVAFRSISWLWALELFKGSPHVSSILLVRLLKFLYLQARHLETYLSTYFSPNTHLTGEALGLFYLGTMLPEFKAAPRWQKLGQTILLEQLPLHVQPDGVYFEQSSYYHRYTTDFYTHFFILSSLNCEASSSEVKEKLQMLLDHLMYITRPDGTSPLFGDDDGGRLMIFEQRAANDFRPALATGAALFKRADYKYVAGSSAADTLWLLGPEGVLDFVALPVSEPRSKSISFRDGGYYVMRDGWGSTANYLLIDCGPHGMKNCGHAHADALSFELAANGRTLLVDPGTYTYTGSRELRDLFRSSSAHNTLTVDLQSSSEPAGPFSWRNIARCSVQSWISHERFDYFEGSHDGYERLPTPARHSRGVFFLKGDYWVIHDRVSSAGNHLYDLWFHLAANLKVDISSESPIIYDASDFRLKIACFGSNSDWRTEEGYVSNCYCERTLAQILKFSAEASGDQSFLTLLLPQAETGEVPRIREVEALGGRAFEIASESGHDVLMVRNKERAEMSRLASDFDWTWARYADEVATIPEQLVLIGGQWLELGGKEVLRSGRRINYLAASRVGDEFRIETDDGVLQLHLPIVDFELALKEQRAKG